MSLFAQESPPQWPAYLFVLAGLVCLGVWAWLAVRVSERKALLPYQPRLPVPWRGMHLFLVVLIYATAQVGMVVAAGALSGAERLPPPTDHGAAQTTTEHAVAQLLADKRLSILLLCGVAAAVVAPIFEEFLFRVLLQGWLEATERHLRRRMPALRRLIPGGVGPVVLSSIVFASVHFRGKQPTRPVHTLAYLLIANALANLLTMACAVGLLRSAAGATAADFGWVPRKFLRDAGRGLLTYAAVAVPVYLLQAVTETVFQHFHIAIAPDPFTLFFFALALGTLYYRTHRIVPSVVAHASLNATTLALAWFWMGK